MRVVLEKDGDGLAEVVQPEGADIVTIEENLALLCVVQPRDELEDGALPGAVRADDDT